LVIIRAKSPKHGANGEEIWAKYVPAFAKTVVSVRSFFKNGSQNESEGLTFLFFRSHVLIWLFSSKLGEIWKSLGGIWAKMVLEVPFAQ